MASTSARGVHSASAGRNAWSFSAILPSPVASFHLSSRQRGQGPRGRRSRAWRSQPQPAHAKRRRVAVVIETRWPSSSQRGGRASKRRRQSAQAKQRTVSARAFASVAAADAVSRRSSCARPLRPAAAASAAAAAACRDVRPLSRAASSAPTGASQGQDDGAGAAAAAGRWPGLAHFSLDGRGIRAFAVDRVPSRLVLDAAGGVRRRWDGSHGRVLQGRHGASLANGSHTLVRELVDVVHGPDPARRAP